MGSSTSPAMIGRVRRAFERKRMRASLQRESERRREASGDCRQGGTAMLINWTPWRERAHTPANPSVADGEQRQLTLLSKGVRLHAGFVERSDHCSLAVLDRAGI